MVPLFDVENTQLGVVLCSPIDRYSVSYTEKILEIIFFTKIIVS